LKMYTISRHNTGFTVRFSASFEGVNSVCLDIEPFLSERGFGDLCFDIILSVREVLNNAVQHGSKMDSNKDVCFYIDSDAERIQIRITDSGSGFDWRRMEKKVALPENTTGRGMNILKQYFDSYRYNEIGNEVEFVRKTLKNRRSCMSKITKEGDKVIVKPEKDMVASVVSSMKAELKQVLDDGAVKMAIDMSKVKMMDSMGIGLLIAAHNSLDKVGGQLELLNVSADILKLLKNMRLDKHFIV
jgi:serine/threonine-protein kinase RsbW